MRLLYANTLEFVEFFENIPKYAILSHTWGPGEVTFQDMQQKGIPGSDIWQPSHYKKPGFLKVQACADIAIQHGLEYIWVDTCCIDKTSSADLTEAINSMFMWYRDAEVCFAYLSDVESSDQGRLRKLNEYARLQQMGRLVNPSHFADIDFCKSRWFTRGWTLQELLAPRKVIFYNKAWQDIASKSTPEDEFSGPPVAELIHHITNIDVDCLYDVQKVYSKPLATRMSWAAGRRTTRKEDEAYSLLGLFQVFMPLNYGERERAFIRLQEEIMKESEDPSLLTWGMGLDIDSSLPGGLFAPSPVFFRNGNRTYRRNPMDSRHIKTFFSASLPPSIMTSRGLQIALPLIEFRDGSGTAYAVIHLEDRDGDAILLPLCMEQRGVYYRPMFATPKIVAGSKLAEFVVWGNEKMMVVPEEHFNVAMAEKPFYVRKYTRPIEKISAYRTLRGPDYESLGGFEVDFAAVHKVGYRLTEWHPADTIRAAVSSTRVSCLIDSEIVLGFSRAPPKHAPSKKAPSTGSSASKAQQDSDDSTPHMIFLLIAIPDLRNKALLPVDAVMERRVHALFQAHCIGWFDVLQKGWLPGIFPEVLRKHCSPTVQFGNYHFRLLAEGPHGANLCFDDHAEL